MSSKTPSDLYGLLVSREYWVNISAGSLFGGEIWSHTRLKILIIFLVKHKANRTTVTHLSARAIYYFPVLYLLPLYMLLAHTFWSTVCLCYSHSLAFITIIIYFSFFSPEYWAFFLLSRLLFEGKQAGILFIAEKNTCRTMTTKS